MLHLTAGTNNPHNWISNQQKTFFVNVDIDFFNFLHKYRSDIETEHDSDDDDFVEIDSDSSDSEDDLPVAPKRRKRN